MDDAFERRKQHIREQQQEYAREKLKQDVEKKINTTMIGALSSFEKTFGYLWGNEGQENEPLTEDEEYFFQLWQEARESVLDKGNSQKRAILDELDNYTVSWNRYQYKFKFGNRE